MSTAYFNAGPIEALTLRAVERVHALRVLQALEWNRRQAARVLGVSERTVYNLIADLKRVGVDIPPTQHGPRKGWRTRHLAVVA